MKKIVLFFLLAALWSSLFGQAESHIVKKMSARNIRAAFRAIKTDSATVSGARTFTEVVSIDTTLALQYDETLSQPVDGDVFLTFDDDAATLGELVLYCSLDDSVFADNDLFNVRFRSLDEDSTAINDWIVMESKILDATGNSKDSHVAFKTYAANSQATTLTLTGTTATLANGATLNNSGADSLIVTEAGTHFSGTVRATGGLLTPTLTFNGGEAFTLADTVKAGRWATFTIAGVVYGAIALADTADIVD